MQMREVVVRIVEDREVHQALAATGVHPVEHHLQRRDTARRSHGGGAGRLRRLVVGPHCIDRVHLRERAQHEARTSIADRRLGLGEQPRAPGRIAQRAHPGLDGQLADLVPGGMEHEGMDRRAPSVEHARRPARDRAHQRQTLHTRIVERRDQFAPQLGLLVDLLQVEEHRSAGLAGELAHPHRLGGHVDVVRGHLEHAVPELAEHAADAEHLVARGMRAGHQTAVGAAVDQRARGREPEGAGGERGAHMRGHGVDVGGRGDRVFLGAARAHHPDAQRAVRHLRADVDCQRRARERVEVLGKGLPLPADAFGQRGTRDVLDALHQPDQPVPILRPDRGEADAAVAHHRGGHAMP